METNLTAKDSVRWPKPPLLVSKAWSIKTSNKVVGLGIVKVYLGENLNEKVFSIGSLNLNTGLGFKKPDHTTFLLSKGTNTQTFLLYSIRIYKLRMQMLHVLPMRMRMRMLKNC